MSSTSGEFEVKAVVSESNGEVSCSVEETNRIRKLLGLNPLRIDAKSSDSIAVENFRNKKAAEDRAKEELDVRQKLEQAKNRRLLNAKVQGKTLSDIDSGSKAGAEASDESALGSASDWVQRSRAKAQAAAAQAAIDAEKAKNAQPAADKRRETYESSHLKGLKIKHSAKAFDSLHRTSNLDSLSEGVILTLAEKAILRKDGRGRVIEAEDDDDDEDDMLVNVNLEEDEKRQERERRAKRLKQPVYGGYDDDEFEELNHDGQVAPSKKKLLSHYDLERDEAARKNGNVLVIGDKGSLEDIKGHSKGDDGNQWAGFDDEDDEGEVTKAAAAAAQQSLQIQRQAIADYYTTSEYAAANPSASFSKGKKKTKRVKKVRSKRVAEDEDDDETAGAEGGGLGQLQAEDADMDVVDRGSRRTNGGAAGSGSGRDTGATTFGSVVSGQNYAAAVANARAKNVKTFAPANGASAPGAGSSSLATPIINEEDVEAARQMARARKIAQQQQHALERKLAGAEGLKGNGTNADGDEGAQRVQELLQMQAAAGVAGAASSSNGATTECKRGADGGSMAMDESAGVDVGEEGAEVDAEGRRRRDGRLVFNDTTEFTSLLRARLNEKARLRAEDAVRDQERSEKVQPARRVPAEDATSGVASTGAGAEVGSKRSRDEAGMAAEEDGAEVMDEAAEWERLREQAEEEGKTEGDSDDEKNGEDDQLGFLHRQPLASSGLASALALLKQSDSLKPKEELYGRARDARDFPTGPVQSLSAASSSSSGDRQFNVNIEYRDKQGHLLTKKDAFRQLCYDFHGIGPSRKKEEKRMRDVEKMHKAKTSDLSVAGTMRSLTQTQAATGKAFVTIQGGLGTTSSAAADLAQAAAKGAREKARAARLQ